MLNFKQWAVIAPKNETGFGRMAQDCKSILGIPYHFIATSRHLENKDPLHLEIPLPKEYTQEQVYHAISSIPHLQGVLLFEYLEWNPFIIKICKQLGIKVFCVIMWEWFSGNNPLWKECDLIICPCKFSESIVHSYGLTHTAVLPWAFNLSKFPPRSISGPANLFGHNAGVIDAQDRKGTLDTILAFSKIKNPNIRLIINFLHSEIPLPKVDKRITIQKGSFNEPSELFEGIDVAIQPSKMEGIGFMVLEPVCSGLPTLTVDAPPMHTYVHQKELLVKKRWFKRRALSTHLHPHAYLCLPNTRDLVQKIEWCTQHDLSWISRYNRQWAEKQFDPETLRAIWQTTISPFF